MTSSFQYEINCWACGEDQAAEEQAELVTGRSGDHDDQKIRLAIATCHHCSAPSVLHQELIWDDYAEEERVRSTRADVVWPISDQRSYVRAVVIPEELRREHQEAQRCFNADAYTATVVMVRRALEGVCSHHNISATNLVRALEEMERQGLIEGRLLEWAQELRVLGNQAAHFTGRPVARQDAQDALELAEALLDYLYLFTGRFNAFKKRRDEAQQNASGGGAPAPG
ncbi:DUF4145 domain-containing protein [Nonomuraea rhizosphaerae]|uniref:DUF4145 domain-containing protein n=1 Tax=Nonomuraea rhizosphaerae TaxID=2665663 RepID=UPI001C5F4083|nr:DUF4145 domain-containing protein [Nonomuraea rhizosphaerae]